MVLGRTEWIHKFEGWMQTAFLCFQVRSYINLWISRSSWTLSHFVRRYYLSLLLLKFITNAEWEIDVTWFSIDRLELRVFNAEDAMKFTRKLRESFSFSLGNKQEGGWASFLRRRFRCSTLLSHAATVINYRGVRWLCSWVLIDYQLATPGTCQLAAPDGWQRDTK